MTREEIDALKQRNKILGQRIQRYLTAEPENKKNIGFLICRLKEN